MPAYYRATVKDYLAATLESVQGKLSMGSESDGFFTIYGAQVGVWTKEIGVLKSALSNVATALPEAKEWCLLLEYPIPRRARRADAVLLAEDVVIVIEFKEGAGAFLRANQLQVEDYALDLRDFHAESRGRSIVPVLVGVDAVPSDGLDLPNATGKPTKVRAAVPGTLPQVLASAYSEFHRVDRDAIDPPVWDNSNYWPVPTIIEAAEWLFAHHDVAHIAHSHADKEYIERTSQAILDAVEVAQSERQKLICFVTGVPGAGKTLVGLKVAHSPALRRGNRPAGTFLSGNGPLVMVVSRALVLDARRRGAKSMRSAEDLVRTFITGVHTFYNAHYGKNAIADSYNKVVIFDEAQRAWTRQRVYRKSNKRIDASEPEIMLSIMDKHDWAVVVCLIGSGQEIHDGEAGLAEWGRALHDKYPEWRVIASKYAVSGRTDSLLPATADVAWRDRIVVEDRLHLPVSLRSIRAERLSEWVDRVLAGDASQASQIASDALGDFSIVCSRSLADTRAWLRGRTEGTQKRGLVASSSDRRLRHYGFELSSGFTRGYEWDHWFLDGDDDVRSSNRLEVAATEFQCQGLELDWVGVCWGSDLTRDEMGVSWDLRQFKGSEWQSVRNEDERRFLVNTYRVLLTRARKGLLIWVPPGDVGDPTLDPTRLDRTYRYLLDCGVVELPQ
jgi:hypothetical protein